MLNTLTPTVAQSELGPSLRVSPTEPLWLWGGGGGLLLLLLEPPHAANNNVIATVDASNMREIFIFMP
jgi:hypothetical protein